jgi:hypothetical protein
MGLSMDSQRDPTPEKKNSLGNPYITDSYQRLTKHVLSSEVNQYELLIILSF